LRRIAVTLLVTVSAVAMNGCYGAKMVKGPINSEHAAVMADSIRVDQRRILRELAQLRGQLGEEREARLRSQARLGSTLNELDESVRILTSRVEEDAQRSASGRRISYDTPPPVTTTADSTADTAAVDSTAQAPVSGRAEAEEMYRTAYLDLTRGNYTLAAQGLQSYLSRYPAGAQVPEANYYLGECYYAQERYLEAVGAFQNVVRQFPNSRLVPAAYLKSGYCYRELQERSLAEKALQTLIDEYPNTEEATQARAALDELEG
jgi:tol-pal system protein YbgF